MERKQLAIHNFAKAGLNTDLMPWDLPGDFLTEARNIRITRKRVVPFGGHSTWDNLPVDFQPGYIMPVITSDANYWIIPGRDAVYAYDGSTFDDISSGVYSGIGVDAEDDWNGCMLSDIPVIINPAHYPEYWSPTSFGVNLQPLTWDGVSDWQTAGESARFIRSHKQFLFAMDVKSGANEYADGVRWSEPADIGGVPATWDDTDVTSAAGLTFLGAAGGRIIDGLSLRDSFVVYRESSISIFDFVGGSAIWKVRHLSSTVGLVSSNCLVEIKGRHYFIGDGDIFVNDGNSIQSITHNRIKDKFVANFDPDTFDNSFAVKNNVKNEIWFCVPEAGQTYASVAYIYNWKDDTWAIRDMPGTVHCGYGPQSSPNVTWDTIGGGWDTNQSSWGQKQITPLDDTVVGITKPAGAGQSGQLLIMDKSVSGVDTAFDSFIERIGFALDGLNKVTTISTIYPHMLGPTPVQIQIGSQDYPGSAVRWKTPITFNPETDRKIDLRSTGELHCFRISSDDTTGSWGISGLDIEYVEAGLR